MVQREEPYRRGMVVVAHADDAEYSCSGTVAKWCAEGWDVVYVLCTDGSKGSADPNMSGDRLVKVRQEEQRNAGKVLGLRDVVFLGYEDSMLEPSLALRREIAREIRRHKPDVLICPSPVRQLNGYGGLSHPDHFAAGEATMTAVFPTARDRLTFPELLEEGLEPHKVREVWVMWPEQPDIYVDVTDYIEVAVQALAQHKTQVGDDDVDFDIKDERRQIGDKVGFQYAEAYKRFRMG